MAKAKNISTKQKALNQEYAKIRKRVRANYLRLLKQGYVYDFDLPPIPKKITQASIRNICKYTTDFLRSKAEFVTPEGNVISGRAGLNRIRSDAAKKASRTTKENRERNYLSFSDQFVNPSKKAFEEVAQEYYPEQSSIIINNFAEQQAASVLPMDLYREIKNMALGASEDDSKAWYARGVKARSASTNAINRLVNFINRALRNRYLNKNKIAMNIIKSGQKDELIRQVEKIMYGYTETDVHAGLSAVLSMLKGESLSADEAKEISNYEDEEEY